MKPGCTLHPFRTGIILYKLPNRRFPFGIIKKRHLKDEIEEVIDAGARHIELTSDVIQFTPQFRKKFKKEMTHLEGLEKDGIPITISIHADHIGYSFPARHRRMRIGAVSHFQYLAYYYSRLNPTHFTLHLGPDEVFNAQAFRNLPTTKIPSFKNITKIFKKGFVKNILKEFGIKTLVIEEMLREAPRAFDELDTAGVDLSKIYIENVGGVTRADFDELFGRLLKKVPKLGCVLDTGHLLIEEYERNPHCLEDFVKYWGGKKKLKAVHCHDVAMLEQKVVFNTKLVAELVNDLEQAFKGREKELVPTLDKLEKFIASARAINNKPHFIDHQNLGTGILNLPSFLRALKKVEFDGPVIFEAGTYEGMLDSVKLLAKEIEKVKKEK